MKNILFVDDEKMVLDGLRRSLFSLRKDWSMEFCNSPQQASTMVGERAFDVVVSDMRMPGMDGSQLLEHVSRVSPATLRIVLSGQSEMEATVRAAAVAHQFIAKPCEPNVVRDVLERTIQLHELLVDSDLRTSVGKIRSLPAPPRVYQALCAAMADPDVELDQIAKIVAQDVGLVAKVLQLVNSSFFGLARRVGSVREAVSILGMDRIKSVVLSSEVYQQYKAGDLPAGFDFEAETRHSMRAAMLAREILPDKPSKEFAFLAGMLHDIGWWVLASNSPREYEAICLQAQQDGTTVDGVLEFEDGVPHGRVGAYLLGIWNLPYPVVEAVAHHHRPSAAGCKSLDVLGAVHVADCLAATAASASEAEAEVHLRRLDEDFLAASGLSARLDEWTALARDQIQEAA